MYQQIRLPNQGDAFYKKTKTIPKRANGLDSRKGVHLKNLWSFVFMLIRRDYRNWHHTLFTLPWEWCHDDAETSAFNVNIRLLMF